MKLYQTTVGPVVEMDGQFYFITGWNWDDLVVQDTPAEAIRRLKAAGKLDPVDELGKALAPIGSQEVWAAGVTYLRSKVARMEESQASGGGDFYDKVYSADRPEIFFKATPHRVVGSGEKVRIRGDSKWNVPEPELALLLNPAGKIVGYTIGNDMSSRDIEGENPLYLPQAKVYADCCGLGPCVLLAEEPLPKSTEIKIEINRAGDTVFSGATSLLQMKRELPELADWLFREDSFPTGAYLLTGTGVVPPDSFTLKSGDEVRITIEPIGTLVNSVA